MDSIQKFIGKNQIFVEKMKKYETINVIGDGADNCYCIYKTGSTCKPKGTIIKKKNLIYLL